MPGELPHARRLARSTRPSARCPSAISAPRRASTRPTTCAWATSAGRGRCAARPTGRACARAARGASPTSSSAPTPQTWLALREGELSGVEAFWQRLLYARGDVDLAIGFEGLFRLPNGRPPLLRIHDVQLPGRRVSTLTMGDGPDVRLHPRPGRDQGLVLRHRRRAHARGLPRPRARPARLRRLVQARSPAPYSARWFADTAIEVMDALDDRPRPPGRQLDGRPRRRSRSGCARPSASPAWRCSRPAVAFVKRDWHPIVRLMRPELGLLPHNLGRGRVARQFWSLFADPDQVDPSVADLVVDEFQRIYASAGRAAGLPHRGAQHLPRAPLRARRLLPAAGRARGARAVRVGRVATASSRRGSSATSPSGCPTPSRSSSRTAATSRRSSAPSRRSGCCGASSSASTRSRPRRARARAA